ncbi:hypothetical protein PPL_04408 [Heterostelium album PN500]|uniref:Glutathione S-transferase n=1 Tax=Heterostelium pallidum (strain ATCC 26659 / Pp 5 / PN500) TaxID=670386 RepID=D3B7H0_HETP5|nr:hypothetical protein PPL_04408 [Heterostelium album PN500]EFA82713.1 hypothetical protein PPL_04408 [Heterostelium album PN500]|eukprot:XP_020434830.1 hypothetical protein PPL_04408 [Heterostelium album PN500]
MNISIPITTIFAGALGVIYTGLALNVVKYRRGLQISIGDGSHNLIKEIAKKKDGDEVDVRKYNKLLGAVRAHANFIEYVPIQLILAALLELQGADKFSLKVLLGAFTFSRVIHISGITNRNFVGTTRVLGTVFTFITLFASSVACLYYGFNLLK